MPRFPWSVPSLNPALSSYKNPTLRFGRGSTWWSKCSWQITQGWSVKICKFCAIAVVDEIDINSLICFTEMTSLGDFLLIQDAKWQWWGEWNPKTLCLRSHRPSTVANLALTSQTLAFACVFLSSVPVSAFCFYIDLNPETTKQNCKSGEFNTNSPLMEHDINSVSIFFMFWIPLPSTSHFGVESWSCPVTTMTNETNLYTSLQPRSVGRPAAATDGCENLRITKKKREKSAPPTKVIRSLSSWLFIGKTWMVSGI